MPRAMASLWRLRVAPDDFDGVGPKVSIRSQDSHSFGLRLSDEEAIEGVIMVRWQLRDRECVTVCNRQWADALSRHSLWDITHHRFRQP